MGTATAPWHQVTAVLGQLTRLQHLVFGQCPATVLHTVTHFLTQLQSLAAEFISDDRPAEAQTKWDIDLPLSLHTLPLSPPLYPSLSLSLCLSLCLPLSSTLSHPLSTPPSPSFPLSLPLSPPLSPPLSLSLSPSLPYIHPGVLFFSSTSSRLLCRLQYFCVLIPCQSISTPLHTSLPFQSHKIPHSRTCLSHDLPLVPSSLSASALFVYMSHSIGLWIEHFWPFKSICW